MGVNLSGLVKSRNIDISDLRGKPVAIDAYNTIHQFLSAIRQPDGRLLVDSNGRVTSHLSGLLHKITSLTEVGIEPSFVFDGKPHRLKLRTIEERRKRREEAIKEWERAISEGDNKRAFSKAQQTSRITAEISDSSERLLKLLGTPVVHAIHDGEAQSAYMCLKGDVWASASQDFDSILFGAPRLVRNIAISGRRKILGKDKYRNVEVEMINTEKCFVELGVSREQLVDVCILMGTDFNPGISGIGPKKGLKLIKYHKNIENVLKSLNVEISEYQQIRDIFLSGPYVDNYNLEFEDVDYDGAINFLVEYGFSKERVKLSLDRIERSRRTNRTMKQQKLLDAWL
ncbi:MAG: flap endonuclease-1 [archaeon]|nr:flap endonuclease-1 [archaeon]